MALIINADDFGISDTVNKAICEAFSKGITDRTTLMVNMPGAAGAMELARERGFADKVGLHLNLTTGKPLTERLAKDRLMCNSAGEFTADFARSLKTRFFLPKETAEAVEAEIRAQLDKYRELGGTLWHIDSHHHVHTDPSVWKILKRVLPDYPVTSVRLGRNLFSGTSISNRIYKAILNSSIRRRSAVRQDRFGSGADIENYLAKRPGGLNGLQVEMMVHPVFDSEGKLSDVLGEQYSELTRPSI